MGRYERPNMKLPLFLTVIPAYILGLFILFAGTFIGFLVLLLAFLSHVSLRHIEDECVDYIKAYKRSLITSALLLLSFIPAGWVWLMVVYYSNNNPEDSFPIVAIIYPIICILLIANRVRLTLKRHTEASKPKLSQILAITFINPLLPFLPFIMEIAYLIVTFDGLGL